jgi:hypothetical protein
MVKNYLHHTILVQIIDENKNHLGLNYVSLIPILTKAIQELKAEFDDYVASHP